MRSKGKNIITAIMLLALVFSALPAFVYADETLSVEMGRSGGMAVTEGETVYVDFEVSAKGSGSFSLVLEPEDSDLVVISGNGATYQGGSRTTATFGVKATIGTEEGFHRLVLRAVDPKDDHREYGRYHWELEVLPDQSNKSFLSEARLQLDYDVDGGHSLTAGETSTLRLYFLNRGGLPINNAEATISLPDGITIESGPATALLGRIESGKTKTAEFKIKSSSKLTSNSYKVTVTVKGTARGYISDGSGGYSLDDKTFTFSEDYYIPVLGKEEEPDKEDLDLTITDISLPSNTREGQSFQLTFGVRNNGTQDAEKLKVSVSVPSGVINTTKNTFSVASLAPGATESFSIDMKVTSAPVKGEFKQFAITAGASDGTGVTVSQYAGTLATGTSDKEEEKTNNKPTPILMVSGYSYGGEPVKAGNEFPFGLTLYNTSGSTLRNIKVTVDAAAGAFIPVGSSNSFYVPSIGAGGSVGHTLNMSCGANTAEGPVSVSVKMEYEDGEANKFSSSDTISVPVVQVTRLVVDEILDPGWLMVGEQAYVTVNYHNMGRNQINNLRVTVEGDFTVDGNPSSYIGNMASGRSDYYNFNFFPNEEGPCSGRIIFTYENASGQEQTIEKEFTFNINPGYQGNDEPMEPMEPVKQPMPLAAKIGIGVGALAALAVVLTVLKKRKAKKQEALELDD